VTESPRILVVDDDPPVRRNVSRLLRQWGYRASEARNTVEARKCLDAPRAWPHLILLDLAMPDEDGLSFLRCEFRVMVTTRFAAS
jgi:CheY-like chemotaxis protein